MRTSTDFNNISFVDQRPTRYLVGYLREMGVYDPGACEYCHGWGKLPLINAKSRMARTRICQYCHGDGWAR